jgi:hypothetical protein
MTDKQRDEQADKRPSGLAMAVEAWCWIDVLASIMSIFHH